MKHSNVRLIASAGVFGTIAASLAAVPFGLFGAVVGASLLYKASGEGSLFIFLVGLLALPASMCLFFLGALFGALIPAFLTSTCFLAAIVLVRNSPYRRSLLLVLSIPSGYLGAWLGVLCLPASALSLGSRFMEFIEPIGTTASFVSAHLLLNYRPLAQEFSPFAQA